MNLDQLQAVAEAAADPADSWGYNYDAFTDAVTPQVAIALIAVAKAAKEALVDLEDGYTAAPRNKLRAALDALEAP